MGISVIVVCVYIPHSVCYVFVRQEREINIFTGGFEHFTGDLGLDGIWMTNGIVNLSKTTVTRGIVVILSRPY